MSTPTSARMAPTYEATLGGPILKNKLWFFGAARFADNKTAQTSVFTNIVYDNGVNDKRYEGKLTYAISAKHTLKAAYTKKDRFESNNTFGDIMDTASFYDSWAPENLLSGNYTGVLSPKFFVEAQFSERRYSIVGSGSRFTDVIKGTPIWDRSRGGRALELTHVLRGVRPFRRGSGRGRTQQYFLMQVISIKSTGWV